MCFWEGGGEGSPQESGGMEISGQDFLILDASLMSSPAAKEPDLAVPTGLMTISYTNCNKWWNGNTKACEKEGQN